MKPFEKLTRAFDLIEWMHLEWPSLTHFSFGPAMHEAAIGRIRDYIT